MGVCCILEWPVEMVWWELAWETCPCPWMGKEATMGKRVRTDTCITLLPLGTDVIYRDKNIRQLKDRSGIAERMDLRH